MDTTTTRIPMDDLPENIQEMLSSEKLIDDIERICEHNGLRPEEYGPVLRTTVKLLRGEIPATAYVGELIEVTGIPREKIALIAQEINRDVFNSVKDSLKELHTTPRLPEMAPTPVDTPLPPPALPANIFEQKLGGAFRMPGTTTTVSPTAPTQVIPPAPQPLAPKEDLYREAA